MITKTHRSYRLQTAVEASKGFTSMLSKKLFNKLLVACIPRAFDCFYQLNYGSENEMIPHILMSRLMTKLAKWHVHPAKTRSAWAFAQSDQSLRYPHEES